MDPLTLSIATGAAQSVLGVFGAGAGNAAAQQEYVNQTAFQTANTEFARWQAGFNAQVSDANSQYNYWQETVNYNQSLAYTRSLQNYELMQAIVQAEVVRDTRAAAASAFVLDSQAIGQRLAEASMQDAVARQQYQMAAIKARSRVMASGQEGASIDRLINDYVRQVGDYETIQAMNEGFRNRQYTRDQAAQVATYLSRYNSQQFYAERPYMEPVAPFAPLPALIQAPAPTYTGSGPSSAATGLNIASAFVGGVSSGISTYASLSPLAGSKPAPAPAPARSN